MQCLSNEHHLNICYCDMSLFDNDNVTNMFSRNLLKRDTLPESGTFIWISDYKVSTDINSWHSVTKIIRIQFVVSKERESWNSL